MQIISTYTTNSGKEIQFRSIQLSDLDKMTKYINDLSKEDTFITFSGEEITKKEKFDYISKSIESISKKDKVIILAIFNQNIIGVSDVSRNTSSRKRGLHVGIFGISIHKDFRNEGIGKKLMEITIQEAKNRMVNLKQIQLKCYSPNIYALKLYKELGFIEYGRIPKAILYKGEYVDEITMALQVED